VSNAGPSNAGVVNISDVLPAGLTNVSWTAVGTNGAVLSGASSGTGNVSVTANIPAGSALVQITVNGTVDAGFAGSSLVNTATAVPGAGVTDPSPASSTVTTTVGRTANVRIIKSGPANIGAGEILTYNLRVVNDGPSNAPGVLIKDALPSAIEANATWTATVQNGATVSAASGTGNVDITGNIPSGTGEINIEIKGRAKASNTDGSVFTNTATANFPAGSPVTDPDPSSNSSSVTTKVNNDPVLKVSKSGPATINIGDPINYTIVIRNGGAGNITAAQISDPVPADVIVTSWNVIATGGATVTGNASGTGNNITSVANIPADGNANTAITINVIGKVSTSAHPTFTNTVTVTANGVRESSVVTAVNQSTDIQVQKSGPQTVAAGSAISYSIKVSNSGPIDVAGLLIRDNVPSAIEGLSWTAVASGSASITAGASGSSNIQTTANIPVGAANYITITVNGIVKASTATGSISNTADVQLPAGVTDFNTSNNAGTVKTDITTLTGLSVSKSGPQSGVSGSAITYTIRVINNGPSNAIQAVITDAVPAGIKNVSWTAMSSGAAVVTTGGTGTGNAVSVLGNIPSGAGNAINIIVKGTIDAGFVGQLVNTAVVTPSEAGNPPVNSGAVTTTVVNESNISIVKSGPGSVDAGRTVTYTLDVNNAGPGNAVNATITDQVPAVLTNVSWTATASSGAVINSGAAGTGNAVNVKADLPAGQGSVRVQITGLVPANTVLTSLSNTAVVTPSEAGNPPVTSNEITTSIVKNSALSVLKNGPGTISSGEAITYTIAISNAGPSEAVGAKLSDIVPAEVKNVSWTSAVTGGSVVSAGASGTGNTVGLTATVPANGTILVTVTGKVDAVYSGALINKATITPSEAGKPAISSQVTTIVKNVSALRITKTGVAEAIAGQQMKYVIKVANDGPGTAQNAVITDAIPQALTNVSWTASAGGAVQITSGSTGTGNALSVTATIPAGVANELIIDITGTINPAFAGKLINTAKATPSEPGNLPVVTPPVETNVKRNPGVSVIKTGPAQLKSGERITYTIEVGNNSLSNAENLTITDIISNNITNVEWSTVVSGTAKINTGGTGSGNNLNVTADLPTGTGNKIIITVTGIVSKSFTGRITNTATATPSEAGVPPTQSNTVETIIDYADFIIPNVITPNGDGSNDVFKIKGIENYPGTEIYMVNRWGNEVYKSSDYKNDWDGSQLNEGTYYYVVKRREKTGGFTTFRGWVFIKR
ncbi:T9SS type B sorting domain-containing protein, partial [Pedobacter frigoris]